MVTPSIQPEKLILLGLAEIMLNLNWWVPNGITENKLSDSPNPSSDLKVNFKGCKDFNIC